MGFFADRTPQPSLPPELYPTPDHMASPRGYPRELCTRPQPIADPLRDLRRDVERLTGKLSRGILRLEKAAEDRGFDRGKRAARANQATAPDYKIRRARLEGRREGIAIGEERARKRFAALQRTPQTGPESGT